MAVKNIFVIHFLLWSLCSFKTIVLGEIFEVKNDSWYFQNEPIILRSGDLHYFRTPPSLWEDRIIRLSAMGLNTIQTYVPWNFHELDFEGNVIDFNGERNLLLFLDLAAKHNMFVLLRPGPYICAEWDFGGLPARLLAIDGLKIRSNEILYMKEVRRWFNHLLPKLKNKLIHENGPIIAVQIENEFGFWGNATKNKADSDYLESLVHIVRGHLGNKTILYTTDYANEDFMSAGSLIGGDVISLGDFGPFVTNPNRWNMIDQLQNVQKRLNVEGLSPPMCTEFYTGWLTHWGEPMARTSSKFLASSLDYMLHRNTSVNLYMAVGGTNFEFWAGANNFRTGNRFDITSYDYNAPLSESGMHNIGSDGIDKYEIIRQTFTKHFGPPKVSEPMPLKMLDLDPVICNKLHLQLIPWIKENVDAIESVNALSMEKLGQRFGFTLYSTIITDPFSSLVIGSILDRAQVFLDGQKIKDVTSWGKNQNHTIHMSDLTHPIHRDKKYNGHLLEILVENLGRVNFGHQMTEQKGLIGGVQLDGLSVHNWNHFPMEFTFEDLSKLKSFIFNSELSLESDDEAKTIRDTSGFYHGRFNIMNEEPTIGGTYISLKAFCRGYVWINEKMIGKYWSSKGPQTSLFVAGEFLHFTRDNGTKTGLQNHIIILEMEDTCQNFAERRNITFTSSFM